MPTGKLVAAGTLGAFLGFFGGGAIGAAVGRASAREEVVPVRDSYTVSGFMLGALAGSAIGISTAVHLANGRSGSFSWSLGGAALVGALAVVIPATVQTSEAALLMPLAPLGMIAVSVKIEQATGR